MQALRFGSYASLLSRFTRVFNGFLPLWSDDLLEYAE
jgi:hypothetical protein